MDVWESTLMRVADNLFSGGVKPVIRVTATPGEHRITVQA